MEKQNYPVHYITEKKDIYEKYCNKTNKCLTIIPITRKNYKNNGDFLQKYLTLILKLKVFLSGKYNCYDTITYLFYNIEYITYIAIGHGVCYFKQYLFKSNRLYGSKRNDKILIPPSKKLLLVAKRYGWKDENIIKMNLPRWDKYNNDISIDTKNNNKFRINSIFLMFTWRNIKKRQKISNYYINNIISLLQNSDLRMALKQNNIELYFTFHRLIREKYKTKFGNIFSNNQYINYIEQNEISNCLSKTSLVITDFSSIIFDFIYRKKPFIMFIPDADDPNIRRIYLEEYYELIESLKNGTISFENTFFEINSVVEKIIFYIKNNFTVEKQLSKFYDSFEINQGPNINNFINYLHNLK
jgi:CDP-glycerol glycerophosphotransferase (TagB/SpsB family)